MEVWGYRPTDDGAPSPSEDAEVPGDCPRVSLGPDHLPGGETTVRLTVVGCSGSYPGPQSPASCYLVEADDAQGRTWRVLLDLGSGALGALQRVTVPRDLDAVLLSHLHADHCLDICSLYVLLRYDPGGRRAAPLPVYGPGGTLARLERAYDAGSGRDDGGGGMAEVFDVGEWTSRPVLDLGPLRVRVLRVDHPVESYGMRLECGGRVLTYTGDSDSCEALGELARGADLLLAEASCQEGRDTYRGVHLTGRRAGELARDSRAGRLLLTHVPPWTDAGIVLAEARSVLGEAGVGTPVELACPGATHTV